MVFLIKLFVMNMRHPTFWDKISKQYVEGDEIVFEITDFYVPNITPEEFKEVLDSYEIVLMEKPLKWYGLRCKGLCDYRKGKIYIDMAFLDIEDTLIHEVLHAYYKFLSEYFIRDIEKDFMRNPEIRKIAIERLLKEFKGQENEIIACEE